MMLIRRTRQPIRFFHAHWERMLKRANTKLKRAIHGLKTMDGTGTILYILIQRGFSQQNIKRQIS